MFFSGDASARKRVDLGGRSSKERDRQVVLEQARLERQRRLWLRLQNSAALKIQKCFRGRKVVEIERSKLREQFFITYGDHCQKVDRNCFGPDSEFLRQILFFFNGSNKADFVALVETCRLLLQFFQQSGDIVGLFSGADYYSKRAIVDNRVEQLVFCCLQAVHRNRDQLKYQLHMQPRSCSSPMSILLEAMAILLNHELPWSGKVVHYIMSRKGFALFRDVLVGRCHGMTPEVLQNMSSLEHIICLVASHIGHQPCSCSEIDPRWSFSSQILSIPFLWKHFPCLKEVFMNPGVSKHYIHQMMLCLNSQVNVLPHDISRELPGYACLLGNLLEVSGIILSGAVHDSNMANEFAAVTTCLLEALPSGELLTRQSSDQVDNEMVVDNEETVFLRSDLGKQIANAIDSSFLQHMLQDWNNRRSFTLPTDFHVHEAVGDNFISQAMVGNTRAHDILKQAPFLVPFNSRVKIFTSQLAATRQRNADQLAFTRNRFKIRRNRIFEDAFNQLSHLTEEELKGMNILHQ